jgi:hypothetical protein
MILLCSEGDFLDEKSLSSIFKQDEKVVNQGMSLEGAPFQDNESEVNQYVYVAAMRLRTASHKWLQRHHSIVMPD